MQMIAGTDFSRRRRGPFLSPIEIVVLATMVGALLLLLFPGRDFENPKHLVRADDLSMAYLRMLLRAHPEDQDARLLLVQQQMALGRFEEARETLGPLRGRNDALGAKAEVVALKLDRARLYALPIDDPNRAGLQTQVKVAAERLLPRTQRPEDIADLADFLLSLGQPATAADAYKRLASLDRPNRIGWLEKSARWRFAAGDPASAAEMYSEGALGATDVAQGSRLGRLAMTAMLAANQGRAALGVVRPIVERYPRDLGILELAVRMAVASGDLSTARRWGEQRVLAAGSSDKALREQIDILTKAGDPEGALRVARTLLARNGAGDSSLRRQMAQLARWSGQPEESLTHWVWLARRGSEEARQNALNLAQALADVQVEVEMLELRMRQAKRMSAPRVRELEMLRKQKPTRSPRVVPLAASWGRRRPLAWPPARRLAQAPASAPIASSSSATPEKKKTTGRPGEFELAELISLADALEAKGLPERAIKAMDDFRFNFADRPEYWVRIARLYENVGELEQALACLEQLNRLKAMTLDDGIRQAKLLWRLLRPEAALTRLVGLRGQARETETDYWRLVGTLAWRVENDLLASEAFGVLWKSEKTADVAEPLFRSLETLGRHDEAIAVAEEAYKRLGASGFLVAAVDLAVRQGRLDRAKGLFAQANGKEKQFELETHFWFQRAQLAISEEKFGQAESDLQRVLAIDPGSEDAHIEWLTLALHAQDRGMAERALRHWGPGAEEDSESWGLLADAYGLLGDDDQALRFRRLYREERTRQ
ncbi:MAG TPA: tetratricopeptide repeat protein, partial [Polyangia bacterium]